MQCAAGIWMPAQEHAQSCSQPLLLHVLIRRQFLFAHAREHPFRAEDQLQGQQPPEPTQRIALNQVRACASQTYTATLRLNGASTAVTCTISGASSQNCTDNTHVVAIPAGSVYGVQFVSSASAATAGVTWGLATAP